MDRRRMRPEELGRNMICLGKAGENGALALVFDCAEWLREYPEGTIRLYVQTAGEEAYYPPLGTEGTDRTWVIDSEKATKAPGNGVIELLLIDAESGTTIKSETGYTTVKRSPSAGLEDTDGEPGYVRYDAAQALTDDQKAQARANIGAGTGSGNGEGTGEPGADGEDGGYYTPAVDASGNLTWSASKADMPSVPSANIKGPAGRDGNDGKDGPQGLPGRDGRGIVNIERTGGDGSAGTVDTYTITYTDGTTSTYTVTNGKNGQNASGDGTLSVEIDETLSISGAAADAKMTGDRLNELKEANATQDERLTALEQNVPSGTGGLTTAQINALDGMFKIAAYTTDAADAYAAFKTAFGIEDDIEPDDPDVPVVNKFSITNTLQNVTTSNPVTSVSENSSYMATLTPDDGYTLDGGTVTVTMGGVDVTDTVYADGVITIAAVTGAVVITVTAVAVESGDDGELVYLKNISFDGTSYLDTGFIPTDVNEKYVLGVQSPGTEIDSTKIWFAGVSMRNKTSPTDSDYFDIMFKYENGNNNYNADRPASRLTISYAGKESALGAGSDKGDGLSSQFYDGAMYASFTNGSQSLWMDEELTVAPTAGHFAKISHTDDLASGTAYDAAKFPIQSMWIGRPRVTSSVMEGTYGDGKIRDGMKFYCFKVFDTDNNLIVNLRPAKKGSAIGMYDEVTQKFIAAEANGGVVNYEEVSA